MKEINKIGSEKDPKMELFRLHNLKKSRLCMASVRNQQNRLCNRLKILCLFFSYFLNFFVSLSMFTFVFALKTSFSAFESYFYGLGSTVTHKKFFLFDTQKLPKNREFLAWNLFCNIDMELVTRLERATSNYNKAKIPIQLYRDSLSYSV